MGEDYATISLLPNATHDGSVLALQGLQQEEPKPPAGSSQMKKIGVSFMSALGISASENLTQNIWFEALIRSRTVSGAPNSTTLVAVRRITLGIFCRRFVISRYYVKSEERNLLAHRLEKSANSLSIPSPLEAGECPSSRLAGNRCFLLDQFDSPSIATKSDRVETLP